MWNPWKVCAGLLMLAGSAQAFAGSPGASESQWRRGDFVRVNTHSGSVYHLRLSGFDDNSLVGRNGSTSVHLRRSEIAAMEHEPAPRESLSGPTPSTAMLSLLGLSAARMGAATNFGAGQACSTTTSAC